MGDIGAPLGLCLGVLPVVVDGIFEKSIVFEPKWHYLSRSGGRGCPRLRSNFITAWGTTGKHEKEKPHKKRK